jgi:PAS domain-containing protein
MQGHVIISNNAIVELLGYSPEELKELSSLDFYCCVRPQAELLELTRSLCRCSGF